MESDTKSEKLDLTRESQSDYGFKFRESEQKRFLIMGLRKFVTKIILKNSKLSITKDLDSENKKNSMKTIFFKYTVVPIIPLMIIATLATDPQLWATDGHNHFYFEMMSVMLSFIVAYYFIMRAYALRDKLSLFIGLGFHVGGIIDLLHGVFALLNFGDVIFEGYFIPQTWKPKPMKRLSLSFNA